MNDICQQSAGASAQWNTYRADVTRLRTGVLQRQLSQTLPGTLQNLEILWESKIMQRRGKNQFLNVLGRTMGHRPLSEPLRSLAKPFLPAYLCYIIFLVLNFLI